MSLTRRLPASATARPSMREVAKDADASARRLREHTTGHSYDLLVQERVNLFLIQDKFTVAIGAYYFARFAHIKIDPGMAEGAAAIATDFGFVGFDGFRRIDVRRHSFALSARGLIDHVRR